MTAQDDHVADLYAWLCRQPNLERSIASLDDDALRSLNGHLARMGVESGVPALLHGLVICEACDRFMQAKTYAVKKPQSKNRGGGA